MVEKVIYQKENMHWYRYLDNTCVATVTHAVLFFLVSVLVSFFAFVFAFVVDVDVGVGVFASFFAFCVFFA